MLFMLLGSTNKKPQVTCYLNISNTTMPVDNIGELKMLDGGLKRYVKRVLGKTPIGKRMFLPLQFSARFKESGVEGELAYVVLDNGRKLYRYRSKKDDVNFYRSIADRAPATLTEETWRCAIDVAFRYLRDLPYPRALLPSRGGTIAEIGAYLGHKTIKFVDDVVGDEGKVLAIEIMPDNFAILERNIRENNIKNVTLKQIGAWNEKQTREVIGAGMQQNSLVSFDERPSFASRGIVHTDTLDNILSEWDVPIIDFLNIRVNGAEIEVLQGLNSQLSRVKVIFIAVHYTREGEKTELKVKELLKQKGCEIVLENDRGIYAKPKQ
jgi:FkbM family methyltransferase